MQQIKVIIGANYGDEGKGLATDYFGAKAADARASAGIINVLTNGGPQRGHTVELPDGRRHIFKHFGAASFRGAATYLSGQFLVNPMEFMREYEVLHKMHQAPEVYMDPSCRFTTPWDMLVNQMLLRKKGIHNSCGFGIWETVLRCQRGYGLPFSRFIAMSRQDRISFLVRLRDGYFLNRLRELEITGPETEPFPLFHGKAADYHDIFFSDALICRFEEDCESLRLLCPARGNEFLRHFGTVLFENAQGLMLDGNAAFEKKYTTPSTTGVGKVLCTIENTFHRADVEVCYVTRSYLTRHGDGTMPEEITAEQLEQQLPHIKADKTNIENCFQGGLRYGIINPVSLKDRIRSDFLRCKKVSGNHYHASLMITHMNENTKLNVDGLREHFDTLYQSDGRDARFVAITKTAEENSYDAVRTAIPEKL